LSKDDTNKDPSNVDPNAHEPTSDKAWGGKRAGAGRPKGSKNQFSKHSVDRLKELEFDPMQAMVDLFHDTCRMITEMDDPNHSRRYSAQAMASLIITKQKLINDLMRYGYRHVPEKIESEITEKKPMQINLTGVTATGASVEPAKPDDADAEGDSPDTRH
jgi:hypothetical protein